MYPDLARTVAAFAHHGARTATTRLGPIHRFMASLGVPPGVTSLLIVVAAALVVLVALSRLRAGRRRAS